MGAGRVEKILRQFYRDCRSNAAITGIAFAGSLTTGAMGPYSDIDVYLLYAEKRAGLREWETLEIHHVEFEIFRHTEAEYEQAIRQGKLWREIIQPLATCKILFDRDEVMARLRDQAAAKLAHGQALSAPDQETQQSIGRALRFGYRKAGNALSRNDAIEFERQCGYLLYMIPLHVMTLLGRRETADPVGVLRERAPALHAALAECAGAKTRREKWESLGRLVGKMLSTYKLGSLPQPLWDQKKELIRLDQIAGPERESDTKVEEEKSGREAVPGSGVHPGDWVEIEGMAGVGRVVEVDAKRKQARVMVHDHEWVLPLKRLAPTEAPEQFKLPHMIQVTGAPVVMQEIDLHGMRVEDALALTDRALDQAVVGRLKQLKIIHGHGTGAVRNAIREMLQHHPHVAHFRFGSPVEGGLACTVVEIRQAR